VGDISKIYLKEKELIGIIIGEGEGMVGNGM
jgi:hypothetical protein